MSRVCSRPGCSSPATVTFTFLPGDLTVWVGDLAEEATAPGHDLCAEHGARLSTPRGWTLHDERTGAAVAASVPALTAQSPMLARAFRSARAS